MIIECKLTPEHKDLDFLTEMINQETKDFGTIDQVAFLVKNQNNQIVAGCNCYIMFGSIHIDQLWVDLYHRRQGIGRRIVETVHDYGCKINCTMATVFTMSFLLGARAFYEKLNYTVDFERSGYISGCSAIFYKRNL